MSVPLDRLYNFLQDITSRDDLIIYRFFPHGSKKITDLKRLVLPPARTTLKNWTTPVKDVVHKKFMFMHDQEPLHFDLYSTIDFDDPLVQKSIVSMPDDYLKEMRERLITLQMPEQNIKIVERDNLWRVPVLLVHSELRSQNLQRYEQIDFIGVYWWCHAVIARDWFRYAEHDCLLKNRAPQKDFLIYNRAWSGTREYRLKFAELLVDHQLSEHCVMGFNCEDSGDYRQHTFQNPALQIQRQDLENYFFYNDTPSSASADYDSADYQSTELEVVLETLFDDDRLQLTEKILRPIACGHPFMLLSTVGSLEYLRRYGFRTFDTIIDETYDTIQDPAERLIAVVAELRRIASLDTAQKQKLYSDMREIARYNQELFFSTEWHDLIVNEYLENFKTAMTQLNQRHTLRINHF
jgi:hypothetical protein